MSVFSIFAEISSQLEDVGDDDRVKSYLIATLDELEDCIAKDDLALDLIKSYESIRKSLYKKIKGGDFGRQTIAQMALYVKHCRGKADKYSENLDGALKKAVTGSVDLGKIETNLLKIDLLTGNFITDLLNRDYSPTHLFNRAEMFTRHNNYGKRNFIEQYDHVIGKLRAGKINYEVVYAIEVHSPEVVSQYLRGGQLQAAEVIDERFAAVRDKLERNTSPNIFVKTSITSTDHVSAAWKAKELIESSLDYALTFERDAICKISAFAAVGWNGPTGFDIKPINIGLLQKFLTSEGGSYFGSQRINFQKLEGSLDINGKGQLRRCFRHIRLSRESEFTEEKLLNMWIALESLYSFGQGSIIDNILRYIPRTYAAFSLTRRMQYLRKILVDNSIEVPESARVLHSLSDGIFSERATLSDLFVLFNSESLSKDLFFSIQDKEHLKFKILQIHDIFKSKSRINKRFRDSATDVERQLRRIYVLRNKITHTGYYGNVRPQLITHLYDYVINSLQAVHVASEVTRGGAVTISDLFDSFSIGLDLLETRMHSDDPLNGFGDVTPTTDV
ncbi:hypothetical protein [Rhodanobacter sp. TND4FH1]